MEKVEKKVEYLTSKKIDLSHHGLNNSIIISLEEEEEILKIEFNFKEVVELTRFLTSAIPVMSEVERVRELELKKIKEGLVGV